MRFKRALKNMRSPLSADDKGQSKIRQLYEALIIHKLYQECIRIKLRNTYFLPLFWVNLLTIKNILYPKLGINYSKDTT